jgi:crotonobetainyl-CoA:carnitine CoA-transferase CaiB-like acyl-CoA transferase
VEDPHPSVGKGLIAVGALDGIRVADFTRAVTGPYCTMLLGDLGADVVKVEEPGAGDEVRAWGPPFVGGESTYFLSINRNKRSVCLDLKDPAGLAHARDLILASDILVENFRPGVLDRLGLGYAAWRDRHPRLIYCAISGFGQDGPYRDRAGYDVFVQAMGGLMGVTGAPGGEPVKTGVPLVDMTAGLYAVAAILAALYHRERTGEGQRIDVSLLGAELSTLINLASVYLVAGQVPSPQGSAHASIVPYQVFPAADGYIMVGAPNDRLFARVCDALGHPEWAADPRFATNAARVAHREVLLPLIASLLRTDTVAAWEQRLVATGAPVAPVNTMDRVFADPQVQHSGQVLTVDHPAVGPFKMVGPPVAYSATPARVQAAPPLLGQHTAEVLAELAARHPAEQPSDQAAQ